MVIASRLDATLIKAEIAKLYRPNVGRIVVLVDQDIDASNGAEIVDVRKKAPSVLNEPRPAAAIYAVHQDDLGLPFIERLVALRVKFYPVFAAEPARWSHKDQVARRAIEAEHAHQTQARFDKFDFGFGDAENICQALHITRNVAGAYVEVGCYRGSSARVALEYMKRSGIKRASYFLDVFEGFTYPEAHASSDAIWANSHATDGIEIVTQRLRELDPDAIVLKNNIITDDLPGIQEVAVANLDVDQIEAVYAGLVKLAPKIAVGGILIVEDPGHTPLLIGAHTALQQFLATDAARPFAPIYMASGQYFLVKNRPPGAFGFGFGQSG
jgi:hypothetical protein